MGFIDHYVVLGVAPDAEDVVIKAAFKAMMLRCHPDTNSGNPKAAEQARKLNAAYAVLRDPHLRAEFDRQRAERSRNAKREQPKSNERPGESSQTDQTQNEKPKPKPEESAPQEQEVTDAPSSIAAEQRTAFILWSIVGLILLLAVIGQSQGENSADYLQSPDSSLAASEETPETLSPTQPTEIPAPAKITVAKALKKLESVIRESGIVGGADESRICFKRFNEKPSWQAFDYCVAFDFAASSYDVEFNGAHSDERLGHFREDRLNERHETALRQLVGADAIILDTARRSSLKDLVQEEKRSAELRREALFEKEAADLANEARLSSAKETLEATANEAAASVVNSTAVPEAEATNTSTSDNAIE
jgi:curved DNA-binding protein CbpA